MFQAFILSVSRGNDYITLFRAFQEVYSYQSYIAFKLKLSSFMLYSHSFRNLYSLYYLNETHLSASLMMLIKNLKSSKA